LLFLVKDEAHIAYHSFPLNIQGKEMIELDLSQIHFRTCQILIKKNNLVSAFLWRTCKAIFQSQVSKNKVLI